MSKIGKKFIVLAVLAGFLSSFFVLAAPRPARAFAMVTTNPDLMAMEFQKKVEKTIGATIMQAGTLALVNALNFFVQKLAYDAAVWIAAGGSGEKPLFDGKSTEDYFKSAALDTAAKFITDFSDGTLGEAIGFDVCQPAIPSIAVKLALGAIAPFQQPEKPRCDWNSFYANWDTFVSTVTSEEILKKMTFMFEPGQNELSYSMEINNRLLMKAEEKYRQAFLEKLNNKGWQPVKNILSKQVTTPADVVRESFGKSYFENPGNAQIASWSTFGNALGSGAWQILPAALQNFANTLVTQAMSRLVAGIFQPNFGDTYPTLPGMEILTIGPVGKRAAEKIYSDFITPKITSQANYDPLIEFTTCPTKDVERQINNCVLDDGFATAVRAAEQGEPLTVAEAMERGYLDGGRPLIPSTDDQNVKKDCYQKGYCYSNLVKLRKARIVPVGFELAAELSAKSGLTSSKISGIGTVNLKTVVENFNNCNASGARDSEHPFCHLIDPNWVLRAPKTQCLAQVYGPTLASSEGAIRSQVCADSVSCISEDENGSCIGGWGYCTKEKNVWRISADKCEEQYNTCLTYKSRLGNQASYLKNTVDFGVCNEQSVGCLAYSVKKLSGNWSTSTGDTAFFNKNLEKCNDNSAGCTELYAKEDGLAYNLLPNSSFETIDLVTAWPEGWTKPAGAVLSSDGTSAKDGVSTVRSAGATVAISNNRIIKLEMNTAYTLSFYAKKSSVGADARAGIWLYTNSAGSNWVSVDKTSIISTCKIVDGPVAPNKIFTIAEVANDDYVRYSCAFLTPYQTLYARIFVAGNAWIDAVQFEEGAPPITPTPYLSSGYGDVQSVFIKVPPAYLNCDAGSGDPQCANYAFTCRENEVGCASYKPKLGGGPAIPAVVTAGDYCPASCVGYNTYKQEKTLFESAKFPLYFIPESAKICNASEVGCDEFTNLDTEAKEYFSFVRHCMKPDATEGVFYTWEGSDTTGYQLHSHKLKKDGSGNPAYYATATPPPPCDATIFKAKLGDANYNPDCREFYNATGQVSYRLLSMTIISTLDCSQYRKTESTQADCQNSGGVWDPSKSICLYFGYKAESISCGANANGCRAYSGTSAANIRFVFQDDFEAGANGWTEGAVSPEALNAGGHSYKSTGANIRKSLGSSVSIGRAYTISFWAKNPIATGKLTVSFAGAGAEVVTGLNVVDLRGDWRYYTVGPFIINSITAPELVIVSAGGVGYYIDNITLSEVSQKLYLIKKSWVTPAECDRTAGGIFLPQAMLGCKAYTEKSGAEVYIKSFSSLCRESAVGCGAFQNTHNNTTDKSKVFNAICVLANLNGGDCSYAGEVVCSVAKGRKFCRFEKEGILLSSLALKPQGSMDFDEYNTSLTLAGAYRDESTIEVPADASIYLVDDGKKYCNVQDKGCSALGQVAVYYRIMTGKNSPQTVYFKNNPENYSSILCTAEGEGCESWTSSKGTDIFKIPERTCEYRNSGTSGGWFKSGTTEACYPAFIKNGLYGIWKNADANYDGAVGICPASANGCTEIVDPVDTSSLNPNGQPYYIIDNEKFEKLLNDPTCAGKVSLEEGCVLFDRTSDIVKKWSAEQTYFNATKEKKLVSPANVVRHCLEDSGTSGVLNSASFCVTDSDCQPASPKTGITYRCIDDTNPKYNSNLVLKVTRDRECGEWLTCRSSYTAYDPMTTQKKAVCAEVGLCNKYQTTATGNSLCANFVIANSDGGRVLNADNYSKRKTGWNGMDYSGYSLSNKYPITDIEVVNVGEDEKTDLRLAIITPAVGIFPSVTLNLDGENFSALEAEGITCKGYPEQDSPFPASLANYDIDGRLVGIKYEAQGYANAKICEDKEDCECSYTKATYGGAGLSKYVTYGERSIPAGVCQGGRYDGKECTPGVSYSESSVMSCGAPEDGGTCVKLTRQDDVVGLPGYCLERDLATPINADTKQRACLTWLPTDVVEGGRDIYNQFRTAGYTPPLGAGKYYCMEAKGRFESSTRNLKHFTNYDNFLSLTTSNPTVYGDTCSADADSCVEGNWGISQCSFICGTLEGPAKPAPAEIEYARTSFFVNLNSQASTQLIQVFNYETHNGEKTIYKDQIDLVRLKSVLFSGGPNGGFPVANTTFFIRPNQSETMYYGHAGAYCTETRTNDCIGEKDGYEVGGLTGLQRARSIVSDKYWYLRYDDGMGTAGEPRNYLEKDMFDFIDNKFAFGTYCANSSNGDENSRNAFAVRFEFDEITGILKNIAVAACDAGDDGDDYSQFGLEISVRMRELCTTIADVASSQNKASTDVVWKNADKDSVETSVYGWNYEMQPYGSASSDIAPGARNWYSWASVGKVTYAGVPWSCYNECGTAKITDDNSDTIDFDYKTMLGEVSNKAGVITYAKDQLKRLFGKVYNVFRWKNPEGYVKSKCEYTTQPDGTRTSVMTACYDEIPSGGSYVSPMIYSFYPDTQLSNGQYRLAEKNRLVVNGRTNGNIMISGNQGLAVVRFYFWADSDHMPVTSIKVDWGDGSKIDTRDAMYKNHKPRCANNSDGLAYVCDIPDEIMGEYNVVCGYSETGKVDKPANLRHDEECPMQNAVCENTPQKRFGNTSEACSEAYFELQHTYLCNKPAGETCEFSPKVRIIDNWESHNGTVADPDGAVYDGKIILSP